MLNSESKVTKLDIYPLFLVFKVIKTLVVIWVLTVFHADLLY